MFCVLVQPRIQSIEVKSGVEREKNRCTMYIVTNVNKHGTRSNSETVREFFAFLHNSVLVCNGINQSSSQN